MLIGTVSYAFAQFGSYAPSPAEKDSFWSHFRKFLNNII